MPVFSFKVDPQSAQRIRAKALAAKTSLSAYLRKAALADDERKAVQIHRRKHPVSGLMFNATGTRRKVTEAEIQTALAEFP